MKEEGQRGCSGEQREDNEERGLRQRKSGKKEFEAQIRQRRFANMCNCSILASLEQSCQLLCLRRGLCFEATIEVRISLCALCLLINFPTFILHAAAIPFVKRDYTYINIL